MTVSLYNDHRAGKRRDVHVQVGADGLRLIDESGVLVSFWPYQGLTLRDDFSPTGSFKLCHKQFDAAELTCKDPGLLKTLCSVCPQIESKLVGPIKQNAARILVLLAAAALSVAMLFASVRLLADHFASLVPLRWENALGGRVAKRLVEGTGECSFTPGVKALEHLSARMMAVVNADFPLRVTVTDDARAESFAVSGGRVVIFSGMVDKAQSPEEFAGLLAHEFAHNTMRHPLAGMIRSLGINFLFSSFDHDLSLLLFSSAEFKSSMVRLVYTEEEEQAADRLASKMLVAALIAPEGAHYFPARLGADAPTYLSRHPSVGSLVDPTAELPAPPRAAMGTNEWSALKNICSVKS